MAYEQIEVLEVFDEFETKMDKSIASLQYEFNNMKAGWFPRNHLASWKFLYYIAKPLIKKKQNLSKRYKKPACCRKT